jgi:hypothetical protein
LIRKIRAPFTEEQQGLLHEHQTAGVFHPYTCATDGCRGILVPLDRWYCPRCSYTQDWAHNPELVMQFRDEGTIDAGGEPGDVAEGGGAGSA